jgi:copper chaperone CopZ
MDVLYLLQTRNIRANKPKECIMISNELTINGMTCQHCVMSLKAALNKIKMLDVVEVQIGSARVEYEAGQVNEEQLETAVKEAGYELVS